MRVNNFLQLLQKSNGLRPQKAKYKSKCQVDDFPLQQTAQ